MTKAYVVVPRIAQPQPEAFKTCGCGRSYSEAEFLALPWPDRARTDVGSGMRWRNCKCGNTIVVPLDPQSTMDEEEE